METSGGIRASLAGRYASALFDLARDERQIESVSASLAALSQTLADSKDLGELVASQVSVENKGGEIKLIGLTDSLRELLTVTRLLAVFDTHENEADAIQSHFIRLQNRYAHLIHDVIVTLE